jgi:putative DNA primase/helicase
MNAETIARSLGGKRAGRQWLCRCVLPQNHRNGDRHPSLLIWDSDITVGLKCMAGCDTSDIIAELRRRGLWDRPDHRIGPYRPVIKRQAADAGMLQNAAHARRIWDSAEDPRGTLAECYLKEHRKLPLSSELANQVLRFHPHCPFENERAPALIVAFRPLKGELGPDAPLVAIQRIRLDAHTAKKIGKAMSLGPMRGAAIKLGEAVTTRLGVGEGLETCLSLYVAGWCPVWALGSSGAIAHLPVLDGLEELTVFADNDANRGGEKAALACKDRHEAAGVQVDICLPDQFKDWNDCWRDYVGRPE